MTYRDIVNNGLILPYKAKYTMKDFKRLIDEGKEPKLARFICVCSAAYYNTECSANVHAWATVQSYEYKLGLQVSK